MASPKLKDFKSLRDIKLDEARERLEMFLNADWVQLKTARHIATKPDSITITHYCNPHNKSKQLAFRIGANIMMKLGWNIDEPIEMFYDNDNQNLLMLVPHAAGKQMKPATTKPYVKDLHSVNLTMTSTFLMHDSFIIPDADFLIDKKRLFLELKGMLPK